MDLKFPVIHVTPAPPPPRSPQATGRTYPGKIVNCSMHRFSVHGALGQWSVAGGGVGDVEHLKGVGWIPGGAPEDEWETQLS